MPRQLRRAREQWTSRAERRWWHEAVRRATRDHETAQLQELTGLAASGTGVTGVRTGAAVAGLPLSTAPVEMVIDGRRLRAGRMPRRSAAALRDALSRFASVPLTAVGRYGPYWVLTFKLATEQLVVLVDHLTFLPDWGGGPGGSGLSPSGPLAALGI